ncbi:hypothetical protein ACHAXH_009669 [Discostella pseudostelligera]
MTETKKKSAPKKAKSGSGKKKLTGYMVFAKEMRPKVLEENSGLSFGEVGKELGKRWRALSDEAKAAYKK